MRNLKILIASLSMFAMLTACGEGFEASEILSANKTIEEAVQEQVENVPVGNTPVDVDLEIANSYIAELERTGESSMVALGKAIHAFEVNVSTTSHPGGASDVISNVSASVQTSCSNLTTISNSTITKERLEQGDRISLGLQGSYEVLVQCTTASCDEMVAGIRRMSDFGHEATILIGLKKDKVTTNGMVSTQKYTYRKVTIPSIFTSAIGIELYNGLCSQQEDLSGTPTNTSNTIDPTAGSTSGNVNAFGGTGSNTNAFGSSTNAFGPQ